MTIEVLKYSADEWYSYSESAHKLVFKEQRDPWMDRISYALLATKGDDVVGYVTCRELDAKTVYWQFGGCLDKFKGIYAVRGFKAFLDYCSDRYHHISTLVKNDNVNYLHLLMKMGFRAIGIRMFDNEIFIEMLWRKHAV